MSDDSWRIFRLPEVAKTMPKPVDYKEFLREPTLSCGVYRLQAGSTDMQGPHDEDEVYYVVEGRARLKVSGEEQTVEPGTVLYVSATSEHSFFEIDEDLTLLVFFAAGSPIVR